MPPLVACGRKWEFGSDDLVIPGCVIVLIRLCWLILQVNHYYTLFCSLTTLTDYVLSLCIP